MPAFTLRLDSPVAKMLTQYCKKKGYKKTTFLNKLVGDFFEKKNKPFPVSVVTIGNLKKMAGAISIGGNALEDEDAYFT